MMSVDYKNYIRTMKETSIDKSKKDDNENYLYVTDITENVIDFDGFLEDFFKSNNSKAYIPESVDTYCFLDGKPCLIEFKNGQINRDNVFAKIGHSVATILVKENISPHEFKNNAIFILVYNRKALKNHTDESYKYYNEQNYLAPKENRYYSSAEKLSRYLGNKAKKPVVLFRLHTFKNKYFSRTITMDKDIFNKYIKQHIITLPN